MPRVPHLLLAFSLALAAQAQDPPVDARLGTNRGASLSIKQVLPDSFPEVRVVFRAESKAGEPVWDLRREQLSVLENGKPCETTCLYPITSPVQLNIALVVDHSGSMAYGEGHNEENSWETIYQDSLGNWVTPPGYTMPMTHARHAVLDFVSDFDTARDAISLVGFSTTVDVREPLTHDVDRIKRRVARMQPTDWTALYDAVVAGVEQVAHAEGCRAVVVLTDGQDNSSRNSLRRAIRKANADSVLVFTIGLGNVDRPALEQLADGTGATAHFTSSASSLKDIYAAIGRSMRAYYSLTYRSVHFAEADTTRDVELLLDFNGSTLQDSATARVPDSLMAPYRIAEARVDDVVAQAPEERSWAWPLGLAVVAAAGAGSLVYRYRRNAQQPKRVLHVWPVPSAGELFIDLPAAAGTAQFHDALGNVVKKSRLAGGINHFDLSGLPIGQYTVLVNAADGTTSTRTLILAR